MAVFVIKPTGYAVPVDRRTICRASIYIHQPKGSPAELNLHFRGIAADGPLPASVDFPLRKSEEAVELRRHMFTDPQPESDVEVTSFVTPSIDGLIGAKAAFGITTGDMMFDDLSLYGRYNRIIGQIGLPWYSIGGNHDLNFEARDRSLSRETFKRIFGPNYYAFEYGGAVFLMLDNVDYLGGEHAKPQSGRQIRRTLRREAAQLRRQSLERGADGQAPRRVHAYSAAHLSRPEGSRGLDVNTAAPPRAAVGAPEYGPLLRPHAYDRASLFRGRGRLRRAQRPITITS